MEGNKRVRRRRRNTVERLKNLLILLLTLSAVVLTVRVLMFNGLVDKGPRGWLDHLLSLLDPGQSVPADDPEATGQSGAAAQPVRIAVCDGVDRFAVQYDPAQADRLFGRHPAQRGSLQRRLSPYSSGVSLAGRPTGPGRVVRLPGRAPVGGPIRLDGRGRQQPLPYCYSPPVGRGPGSGWWGLPVLS